MNVSVHIEIASADELAALARAFEVLNGAPVATTAEPIRQPAPAAKPAIAKPTKPVEEKTDAPKSEPVPAEEPEQEEGVEEVDKALVAKELRAFIAKEGASGPKQALAVLKQFGATRFDDLDPSNYSKFLSALSAA